MKKRLTLTLVYTGYFLSVKDEISISERDKAPYGGGRCLGEIAEKTGLSISNIRFYEKKGLIGPKREIESKYRNYSEEDLNCLNKIILLRKMDVPVETSGELLNKETGMEDVLEQQLLDLKAKQLSIQGAINLCEKIRQEIRRLHKS